MRIRNQSSCAVMSVLALLINLAGVTIAGIIALLIRRRWIVPVRGVPPRLK